MLCGMTRRTNTTIARVEDMELFWSAPTAGRLDLEHAFLH